MTTNRNPKPDSEQRLCPVHLLLVVDSLDVGGAERYVVDLALTLQRKGYDVTVACSVSGPLSEPLEKASIPVRPVLDRLIKRRVSLAYARGLRRLVRESRFDIVHAHVYASTSAAAIATLRTGVPLVITEHGMNPWRSWRDRRVSRWVYRRAEHIIAVSTPIYRLLTERYAVSSDRITVNPNAVVDSPVASTSPSIQLPAEWQQGPLVGVVARLSEEKGISIFLQAAARISPLAPEVRFLIVGDGPLREELDSLAQHLGLSDRAHFLGYRSDARALIELLEVLVLPSLHEGSPLVILEAMSAGIPIVASAVGGIPDQVEHGREGILVQPGDPSALGDAILRLLRDPALASRLGEAGRQRAGSRFSYAAMVQRVEAVYGAVLARTGAQGATFCK